jgi:hypothetical protein
MKRVYGAFLLLYPREYRDLFGPEVLSVFAEAARDHRARGWSVWAWFLVTELSGAVLSAAGHWIDRFSAPGRPPSHPEFAGTAGSALFRTVQEAQNRVDLNLKRMTHAIANHDFASARAYSIEDLKAREEMRKLRDRYGFDDDEMAVR